MLRLIASLALVAGCSSASKPASTTPVSTSNTTVSKAQPIQTQSPPVLDEEVSALVARMYLDDFEARRQAAQALGALGARAAPALPELARCAATEPREPGSSPGQLGDREPVADCAAAIASIRSDDPEGLVAAAPKN